MGEKKFQMEVDHLSLLLIFLQHQTENSTLLSFRGLRIAVCGLRFDNYALNIWQRPVDFKPKLALSIVCRVLEGKYWLPSLRALRVVVFSIKDEAPGFTLWKRPLGQWPCHYGCCACPGCMEARDKVIIKKTKAKQPILFIDLDGNKFFM